MRLYNTLTRKKEEFVPLEEGKVGIYVCGPTVYDYPHIGHARTYIAFDILVRYLRSRGYRVTYVVNITNVDDKIIARAKEKGEDPLKLASRFERIFHEDMRALGLLRADVYPRVTEHMGEIIALIEKLLERGYAYVAEGNVYFSVEKVEDYGKLSGQNLEDMLAGARVEVDRRKRHPMDFALWKKAKKGEICWSSPWGRGRPGWHIECSAMSTKYLGYTFDIHGGAMDLIFPHHENEILQVEGATGESFVRYWVHTGFLKVGGEKMSKSLGNFITIRELLRKHSPEAFRLLVLSAHYRSPIDFTYAALNKAKRSFERLAKAVEYLRNFRGVGAGEGEGRLAEALRKAKQDFYDAMEDDLNTPRALAAIFNFVGEVYKIDLARQDSEDVQEAVSFFEEVGDILGLPLRRPSLEAIREKIAALASRHGIGVEEAMTEEEILERIITHRAELRKEGDYKTADVIRRELARLGIILEDGKEKTIWRLAL
jgi:cysteinyl-tRNA synthetase